MKQFLGMQDLYTCNYATYLSSILSLPGSFDANGHQANGDKWKAQITYKVIAEVDRPGSGEVLKVRCCQKKRNSPICPQSFLSVF